MITEMVHTFDTTLEFMEQSVADLSEQQMVEQPSGVPNHGAWTLGHVTAYHAGQLAVWRRAIGKDSAAVFVCDRVRRAVGR